MENNSGGKIISKLYWLYINYYMTWKRRVNRILYFKIFRQAEEARNSFLSKTNKKTNFQLHLKINIKYVVFNNYLQLDLLFERKWISLFIWKKMVRILFSYFNSFDLFGQSPICVKTNFGIQNAFDMVHELIEQIVCNMLSGHQCL